MPEDYPHVPETPELTLRRTFRLASGSYFEVLGPYSAVGHLSINYPMDPELLERRAARNLLYDEMINTAAHARLAAGGDVEMLASLDSVIDDVLQEEDAVRKRALVLSRIQIDIDLRTQELQQTETQSSEEDS